MKNLKLLLLLVLAVLIFANCRKKEEQPPEEEYRQVWVDALAEFNTTHQAIALQLDQVTMGEQFPVVLENVASAYSNLKEQPAIIAIQENGITGLLESMSGFLNQTGQHLNSGDFPAAAAALGLFIEELECLEYTMKPIRQDPVANDIEEGWKKLQHIIRAQNNEGVITLLSEIEANHLDYQSGAQAWVSMYEAEAEITSLFFHDGSFNPIFYEMAEAPSSETFWNEVLALGIFMPEVSLAYYQAGTTAMTNLGALYSLPIGVVPFLGLTCEDRCKEGATRNYQIKKLILIPNGNNPKDYEDLDDLAEAISKRGGQVVDGYKKIFSKTRPQDLYVKCSWEVCEKNACWAFWDETEWVAKESDWKKVTCPPDSPYNSPPENCWAPPTDADALKAMYDEAVDFCKEE